MEPHQSEKEETFEALSSTAELFQNRNRRKKPAKVSRLSLLTQESKRLGHELIELVKSHLVQIPTKCDDKHEWR